MTRTASLDEAWLVYGMLTRQVTLHTGLSRLLAASSPSCGGGADGPLDADVPRRPRSVAQAETQEQAARPRVMWRNGSSLGLADPLKRFR